MAEAVHQGSRRCTLLSFYLSHISCRQLVEQLLEDMWVSEAVHQDDADSKMHQISDGFAGNSWSGCWRVLR